MLEGGWLESLSGLLLLGQRSLKMRGDGRRCMGAWKMEAREACPFGTDPGTLHLWIIREDNASPANGRAEEGRTPPFLMRHRIHGPLNDTAALPAL